MKLVVSILARLMQVLAEGILSHNGSVDGVDCGFCNGVTDHIVIAMPFRLRGPMVSLILP